MKWTKQDILTSEDRLMLERNKDDQETGITLPSDMDDRLELEDQVTRGKRPRQGA